MIQAGLSDHPNVSISGQSPEKSWIVAIAASAGGLKATSVVLGGLPTDFQAAVLLVQHLDPSQPSYLPEILSRRSVLRVKPAVEGEPIRNGMVYVAPPDFHLMVASTSTIFLSKAAAVHFLRPSADILFQSVAETFMERAIAVVLTGTGTDGKMGIESIKRMHGTVICQDDRTAEYSGMPRASIQTGLVDLILPLDKIADSLLQIISRKDNP